MSTHEIHTEACDDTLRLSAAAVSSHPSLFHDLRGHVGHGSIGVGPVLGFHDGLINQPLCRKSLKGFVTISAHAPSMLRLTLERPARAFGFVNAGATFDQRNPVEFWANYNYVGTARGPCDCTDELRLEAGDCCLAAVAAGRSAQSGHSVWALAPASAVELAPATTQATAANTAVLTIAAFPAQQIPRQMAHLAYSARKHGTELHVRGVDEKYSHVESKVRRVRQWIGELPDRYEHVLYVDCTDTIFARPLSDACAIFNDMGSPIAIGAETMCYPVDDLAWRDRFPPHSHNQRWLNAGMWMGQRAALLNALDTMIELHKSLKQPAPPTGFADLWTWREWLDDDQFLWQIALLKNLFPLCLDRDSRLFLNVGTLDRRLTGNVDCELDPSSGRVSVKWSGGQPAILHFSAEANYHCKQQWAGYLGLLPT
jgi:hypothetical protein